jgi:hypothetical protein
MSECTNGEMRDLLPELVSGRLGAEMQLAVESHVAECEECAEELALLRTLRPVLLRGPMVNTARIAAAVRAQVPATRASARRTTPWRIAIAAAALLAVSAIGYAVIARNRSTMPEVAVTPAPREGTRDSLDSARTTAHGVVPVAPAPKRETAPAPQRQIAAVPAHARDTVASYASAGVLDNLSGLSDDDVRTLTASLDGLSSVPDADPAPDIDPLGATLDDQAAGGT